MVWFRPLTILIFFGVASASNPCVPMYVKNSDIPANNRMNCVCNATYCDTIDRVPKLALGEYVQYTSNIDGLRFMQTRGLFNEQHLHHDHEMTVDITKKFQTILGFGTSFTDASGVNINSLSSGAQTNLLKSYFSPDGIEMNMARVPIAGTDFSTRFYTYDDVVNDSKLAHFNLTWEDFELKIPQIKRSLELSDRKINLLAVTWTAPSWMKTINNYAGGFLQEKFYPIWADYHMKFLDAYHNEGIDFWAISTGNEPLNGIWSVYGFNSMAWLPHSQFKWVRENLGPALRKSKYNQTKIITSDDQRFMVPLWSFALKQDKLAASYIDGFAVHWYFDFLASASMMSSVHSDFPRKFILSTEASVGAMPWEDSVLLGAWGRGVMYVKDIMEDLDNWVGGWVDWNMALSLEGGPTWTGNNLDAAIIVNTDEDTFYKQPMFYALGHFSKFVTEGSIRVGISQIPDSKVRSIAFQTLDDKVVVVILNENDKNTPVIITDPNLGQIKLEVAKSSFQTILYPIKIK